MLRLESPLSTPSRSLSFVFGAALPAPQRPFLAGRGSAGWGGLRAFAISPAWQCPRFQIADLRVSAAGITAMRRVAVIRWGNRLGAGQRPLFSRRAPSTAYHPKGAGCGSVLAR
jgi:hypothetical protein